MKKMKKTKKYMVLTAGAAMALSVAAPTFAAKFPDTAGNSHEVAIDVLSEQGIISGYPDGTFKPNRTLSRSDVVKLLGKYLVTQGYKVPSDYKTNMRFSDLTRNSQDELLQYAAVVSDAGVFKGSNGRLMPADFITRENMAVVLVRAYSEIKGFNFVSYVQGQSFDRDVMDYAKAKAEARAAIEVLDYYNITGVAQYNPKSNTTRGQFAGFLYKWMGVEVPADDELTVKSAVATDAKTLRVVLSDNSTHTVTLPTALEKNVETTVNFTINGKSYTAKVMYVVEELTVKSAVATDAKTLRVVLSDNSAHTVTLPTALEENVETTVNFTIDGKSYTAKVTYVVDELKVSEVRAVNGAQFAIKFNQKVDLDSKLTPAEVAKLISLESVQRPGAVALAGAELSEDGHTLLVTTTGAALAGRYIVKVEGVVNEKNVRVVPYDQVITFTADTTAPTIVGTTNPDARTVVVKFSEPMQAYSNNAMQFKLESGAAVTGITGALEAGQTELRLDLTKARVNNRALTAADKVVATFTAARDHAGNMLSPNPAMVTFSMLGADGVKPTLEAVTQTGPKKFKLTFSERINEPEVGDLYVARGSALEEITAITPDVNNSRAYYVTVANTLDGQYTIGTATNRFITDISGENNTFVTTQTFTQQTAAPTVETYNVVREGNKYYLRLVFDRDMEPTDTSRVRATGSYTLNGYTTAVDGPQTMLVKRSDREFLVELSQLLSGQDMVDATYALQLTFTNFKSTFDVNAATKQVSFERQADSNQNTSVLTMTKADTSITDNKLDNNTVKLVFDRAVDGVTATNKNNYTVQGAQVASAVVNNDARNIVWLTLEKDSNTFTGERDVTVTNLKAENSTVTTPQMRFAVELNENIRPTANVARDSAQTLKLTFSEAVQGIDPTAFAVMVNNQTVSVTGVTLSDDKRTAILTLGTTLAMSNVVNVKAGSTMNEVKDMAGNLLHFEGQQFTYE